MAKTWKQPKCSLTEEWIEKMWCVYIHTHICIHTHIYIHTQNGILLSHVKVTQSCSTLCNPMNYIVHEILQARILEWVAFLFSRGSSQLRDRTQVSHTAGGFFTAEPPGKPKNPGVGSLSLLQWIFLTQESNQDLLHCRQILYQLSYEGSPSLTECPTIILRASEILF